MGKFQTAESRAAAPGGSAAGGPGSSVFLGSAGLGAGGAAGAAGAVGGAGGAVVAAGGASMSLRLQALWLQAELVDAFLAFVGVR